MDLVFAILPIVVLIYVMTKKVSWPSHQALPFAAFLVYGVLLIYFGSDANLINATVLNGALSALTPISIIWGAILLSRTMMRSGAEGVISLWLNGISCNPVAQLMIIGWAFAFMIEGSSGFGTPAAIAAPILVGLGFDPIRVAIVALVMNSVPVSFGAVGTPTWFGFSQIELTQEQILTIGWKSALTHGVAALVVPLMALRFVISWSEIRKNLLYVYLSVFSCVVPYVLLATVNYEFPALVGGGIGFVLSIVIAKKGIGLARGPVPEEGSTAPVPIYRGELIRAFTPFALLMILLIITRVPEIGIKGLLNAESPSLTLSLGSLGSLSVSAALVLKLDSIFGAGSSWSHNFLYVPAFIPFVVVVLISMPVLKTKRSLLLEVVSETTSRMKNTSIALVGALIMVQLMMVGGEKAMTIVIGKTFAGWAGDSWQYYASLLGALGTFFSGSASVSNLTFSGIQDSIAQGVELDRTLILALQSVGAAMGNMVCINNIVAVCSILGVLNKEGFILKKTVLPVLIYAAIAAFMSLLL